MAKRQGTLLSYLSAKKARKPESQNEQEEDTSPCTTSPSTEVVCSKAVECSECSEVVECSSLCCTSDEKAYQPNDKITLQLLSVKNRNFQQSWYKQFPWLNVCTYRKKAFCHYCR